MTWLRVDDGFTEHGKIVSLKRADRWTWLELLCYCSRQGNGGQFSDGICDVLKWVSPAFLRRCVEARRLGDEVGLLEVVTGSDGTDWEPVGNHYQVHDWAVYNGATIEARIAAFLEENPDATANEVHRAVGGNRKVVLSETARLRETGGSTGGSNTGTKVVTRARTPSPGKDKALAKNSYASVDLPSNQEGGGDSAYALVLLLAAVEGSDAVKAQLRSKVEVMALQPYALHSARDELAKAKANGKHIKSDKAYVLAILDRYVEPSLEEPEPEFETNEAA